MRLLSSFLAVLPLLSGSWAGPTCTCGGCPELTTTSSVTTTATAQSPANTTQTTPPSGAGPQNMIAAGWLAGYHWANMSIEDVSLDKYTHLSYFVAVTTDDPNIVSFTDFDNDIQRLKDFVNVAHQHNVKAMLTIGGWTGSQHFSQLLADDTSRNAFATTLYNFAKEYDLDGLDFDWEYPTIDTGMGNAKNPNDTANFLSFLRALRTVAHNLTLSAAASDSPWNGADEKPSTDLSGFASVLDYVALMNYDVNGQGWSTAVGPNAPLYSCGNGAAESQTLSAKGAVDAWVAAGFPANQLVLGVPAYGHAFHVPPQDAVASNGSLALNAPFDNSTKVHGDAWDDPTTPGGTFSFRGMIGNGYLKQDGTPAAGIAYAFDDCSQTPYVYDKHTQVMVSYDNAVSFEKKGLYIKQNGLAGFTMFEVAGDYKDILLDSIRKGVGAANCLLC